MYYAQGELRAPLVLVVADEATTRALAKEALEAEGFAFAATTASKAAYEAGATDFIGKPVEWQLLGQRVRYVLRANHLSAALHRNKSSMANAQRIAHIGSWELNTHTDEVFRIFGLEPGAVPPTQFEFWNRVHPADREVVGVEALLRWNHSELGKISPREFVPLAEETGLIVPIGKWLVEAACAQSKAWQDAGYEPVMLSVNVSSRQFLHHDLHETIANALQESGLDPQYLEIEITESVLLQDDEDTALSLRDLRAMDIRVALDDFGTGYSSLSYLTRFPLDTLKMDRCFVRDVDSDPSASGIAKAVIAMAHSLGARVVAEGVDDEAQAAVLLEHGCDELQGFLFSQAVDGEEFLRFLKRSS